MTKISSSRFDLSIIIPALGEERRIGKTLDELAQYLKTDAFFNGKSVEVIVVSADSPDRTHEIVAKKQRLFQTFVFIKPGPRLGKGRDVQTAMLRSRGEKVIFMDADLATPLHHIPQFYGSCEAGYDVVIGTRNLRKHHPGLLRRFVSTSGNILFQLITGLYVEDSQCGFKMFNAHAARLCFSKLTIMKWGFDMEILAIAKINRLKIKTFRINDWKDMPYSTITDAMLRNSLRSLHDLGHIWLKRIRGVYFERQNETDTTAP